MIKHKKHLLSFSSFLSLAFLFSSSKAFPGKYELSWASDEPSRLIIKKTLASEGNSEKDKMEIDRSALLKLVSTLEGDSPQKKDLEQLITHLQYPEILIGQNRPQQFPPQPNDRVFAPIVELRNKLRQLKDQWMGSPVCKSHLSSLENYYTKFIDQLVTQATSQELWKKYCRPKVQVSLPVGPFRILQAEAQKLFYTRTIKNSLCLVEK